MGRNREGGNAARPMPDRIHFRTRFARRPASQDLPCRARWQRRQTASRKRGSSPSGPIGRERGQSPRRALRSPHTGLPSARGRVLAFASTADPVFDDALDSVSPPRARRRRCRVSEPSQQPDLALRRQCPIEGHDQRRQRVNRLVPGPAPAGAYSDSPAASRACSGSRNARKRIRFPWRNLSTQPARVSVSTPLPLPR